MRMRLLMCLLLLLPLAALAGCGNKGDLVRPTAVVPASAG